VGRVGAFGDVLRPGIGPAQLTAAAALVPLAGGVVDIASPWGPSPSHLANIVWADVFGADVPSPLTRAEAMRVPAVARSRHIICSTIARIDLREYAGAEKVPDEGQPAWIRQTRAGVSPFHRMLWTVDDLVFYGWSCWRRTENMAATSGGRPLRMDRIAPGGWRIDQVGRVELIDATVRTGWRVARADEVVLIPGMHEGLLTFAAATIRHAAALEDAATKAAHNPAAYLALKQTGGTPLTDTEITALVARWAAARRGENGGVAFLNQSIDAEELGAFDKHLVIEGRNAAAVDVARHASLPADLIDAAGPESSLTYQNSRDNDRRAIDYGLGGYMSAISAALSQDDVTARGRRVAFDLEQWLAGQVPGQSPAAPAPGPTSPQAAPIPAPATPPPGETPQ
jgi:hypothetical protein